MAGVATILVLATSAVLFYVNFGLYSSVMIMMLLVVVIAINVRHWKYDK
jgi:hypothetical protein